MYLIIHKINDPEKEARLAHVRSTAKATQMMAADDKYARKSGLQRESTIGRLV